MPIPHHFLRFRANLIFCLATPVFMLLFVVLYSPTFGYPDELLRYWGEHSAFCVPIICSIEMGVLAISRLLLCLTSHRHGIGPVNFLVWQLVEMVVVCLFCDLFLSLFFHVGYFDYLTRILVLGVALNIFPYAFFCIAVESIAREAQLSELRQEIAMLRKGGDQAEGGAIRFVDEKGNTKIMIGVDRIISIESAANYVTILYDDGGKLMRYSLRNTLKGIEDVCAANGLVRCHRSYFVNLSKVKLIRRTPDGVFAEIDRPGVDDIPVSKSYASELLQLFSHN